MLPHLDETLRYSKYNVCRPQIILVTELAHKGDLKEYLLSMKLE